MCTLKQREFFSTCCQKKKVQTINLNEKKGRNETKSEIWRDLKYLKKKKIYIYKSIGELNVLSNKWKEIEIKLYFVMFERSYTRKLEP